MLDFYISSAIFGEKNWLVIYINAKFTCSAAVCRVSGQREINENLAQMHLKTPLNICMCFRHQDTFKNGFLCPVLLMWCCGGVVCSQIQLPAHAFFSASVVGPCLQVFPALQLQGSAGAGLCLHLALSAFPDPTPSGVLTEPRAFTSSARTWQIICAGSSGVMRSLYPHFCIEQKKSKGLNQVPNVL